MHRHAWAGLARPVDSSSACPSLQAASPGAAVGQAAEAGTCTRAAALACGSGRRRAACGCAPLSWDRRSLPSLPLALPCRRPGRAGGRRRGRLCSWTGHAAPAALRRGRGAGARGRAARRDGATGGGPPAARRAQPAGHTGRHGAARAAGVGGEGPGCWLCSHWNGGGLHLLGDAASNRCSPGTPPPSTQERCAAAGLEREGAAGDLRLRLALRKLQERFDLV